MKKNNFYLRDSQVEQLKAIAHEAGLSMAVLIRRAIDKYIDKYRLTKEI